MSGPARGFVLAPAKFGSQGASQDEDKQGGGTRPNFTGLKSSKLGLLAESKLTPSGGAIQGNKQDSSGVDSSAPKTTFSFAPLSKPVSDENKPPTDVTEDKAVEAAGEKAEKKIVFGEKLSDKAVAPEAIKDVKKNEGDAANVFGQNLSDRVVNPTSEDSAAAEEAEKGEKKEFKPTVTSNLFSTAASQSQDDGEKKTLSESAKEYTDSHESNKRKYEEVEVVTGEEEESNVLAANGKLYLFDSEKRNWTERGRGQFRLNDDPVSEPGHLKSRLVMRTVGSLRVILNTKLWPDMVCEKADEKKVRISAFDEGVVKVFLINTSPKDAEKLFTALEYRISQLKTDKEDTDEPPSKKVAPEPASGV